MRGGKGKDRGSVISFGHVLGRDLVSKGTVIFLHLVRRGSGHQINLLLVKSGIRIHTRAKGGLELIDRLDSLRTLLDKRQAELDRPKN